MPPTGCSKERRPDNSRLMAVSRSTILLGKAAARNVGYCHSPCREDPEGEP